MSSGGLPVTPLIISLVVDGLLIGYGFGSLVMLYDKTGTIELSINTIIKFINIIVGFILIAFVARRIRGMRLVRDETNDWR